MSNRINGIPIPASISIPMYVVGGGSFRVIPVEGGE